MCIVAERDCAACSYMMGNDIGTSELYSRLSESASDVYHIIDTKYDNNIIARELSLRRDAGVAWISTREGEIK